MKITKRMGIALILFTHVLSASLAYASYPVTARHLSWDESYTLKQCKTKVCQADDRGAQYINTCSQFVNEQGETTTLIMVVLFSEVYGPDCYCPCVGYFIDEVKKQSLVSEQVPYEK